MNLFFHRVCNYFNTTDYSTMTIFDSISSMKFVDSFISYQFENSIITFNLNVIFSLRLYFTYLQCDQSKQGIVNTPAKMDDYVKEHGFAGWFETSAKENINIEEAARALVNKVISLCS